MSSTQYSNMAVDDVSSNQEDIAYRRRSSSLSSGDGDELNNKDTNNQNKSQGQGATSLSFTDYGRRPARRSSRYTNNNKQQQPPQSTLEVQPSSHVDSTQEEDTNTSSSINNFTTEKKRESWQINTDWDYNYDNSFTSQASLYHVLDELDEEQNDERVDETKQTHSESEEKARGDTIADLDKPNNSNIEDEFELPIQFESNGSSSDISTTFSKPVRNNNNTSVGSLKSNHGDDNETRRSDSNLEVWEAVREVMPHEVGIQLMQMMI